MPEMPAPMINTSTCSMLVVFMAPTLRQVRRLRLDRRGQSFDSSGQFGLQQIGDGLQARIVEHTGQHASVVFDGRSVDEVRVSAREENADAAHLRGFARAAQWHSVEVPFTGGIVFGQHKRSEVFSHGGAQCYAVDSDLRSPLFSQRPGEM